MSNHYQSHFISIFLLYIDQIVYPRAAEFVTDILESTNLRNSSQPKTLTQRNYKLNIIGKHMNASYLIIPAILAIFYIVARCAKSLKARKTRRLSQDELKLCENGEGLDVAGMNTGGALSARRQGYRTNVVAALTSIKGFISRKYSSENGAQNQGHQLFTKRVAALMVMVIATGAAILVPGLTGIGSGIVVILLILLCVDLSIEAWLNRSRNRQQDGQSVLHDTDEGTGIATSQGIENEVFQEF